MGLRRGCVASLMSIAIFIVTVSVASGQTLSTTKWREDLTQLRTLLESKHVNLYHETAKSSFDSAFDRVMRRVDSLKDYQIVLEVMRLVALAHDGHTSFSPADQNVVTFKYYPLILSKFEDGLFVISAPDYFPDLEGLELVSIDGTPLETIAGRITPYLSRDNDEEINYSYPFYLQNAFLLHYAGVALQDSTASFLFRDRNGKRVEKRMVGITSDEYKKINWKPARRGLTLPNLGNNMTYLFLNPVTLSRLNKKVNYWSCVLDSAQTVFFQYFTSWDQEGGPSFIDYIHSNVFAALDAHPGYRLIIDMRYNAGGEPMVAAPLIVSILDRPTLFRYNRPIVLIGTRTFSAAATNALQLKRFCNAMLIGQPSRARPNNPSEGRSFTLHNSGCEISISTEMVYRYPEQPDAKTIPLDKFVPLKFSDYIQDIDKTFDTALSIHNK